MRKNEKHLQKNMKKGIQNTLNGIQKGSQKEPNGDLGVPPRRFQKQGRKKNVTGSKFLLQFGPCWHPKNSRLIHFSPKGSPNGAKSRKCRCQKLDAKNDAEKEWNVMTFWVNCGSNFHEQSMKKSMQNRYRKSHEN